MSDSINKINYSANCEAIYRRPSFGKATFGARTRIKDLGPVETNFVQNTDEAVIKQALTQICKDKAKANLLGAYHLRKINIGEVIAK